jgi:hypothetical protein
VRCHHQVRKHPPHGRASRGRSRPRIFLVSAPWRRPVANIVLLRSLRRPCRPAPLPAIQTYPMAPAWPVPFGGRCVHSRRALPLGDPEVGLSRSWAASKHRLERGFGSAPREVKKKGSRRKWPLRRRSRRRVLRSRSAPARPLPNRVARRSRIQQQRKRNGLRRLSPLHSPVSSRSLLRHPQRQGCKIRPFQDRWTQPLPLPPLL